MPPVETAAALLGFVNVVLIIRRSIWNYPFGLAMVVLYGFVFFEAKLYADALLQAYFFAVQLYGWWNWVQGRGQDGRIVVELLDARGRRVTLAGALAASLAVGWLMATLTDAAAPFWDAAVAGLSVVAQLLLARRKLESWILWIAVDILAVALFWSRELYVTASLYAVFLGLAVAGLVQWWHVLQGQRAAVPVRSGALA